MVEMLCENKADLFLRNKDNQTAFSQISNNLLMVKLLKKQEKAFFESKYTARASRKIKEVHMTNQGFLKYSQQRMLSPKSSALHSYQTYSE